MQNTKLIILIFCFSLAQLHTNKPLTRDMFVDQLQARNETVSGYIEKRLAELYKQKIMAVRNEHSIAMAEWRMIDNWSNALKKYDQGTMHKSVLRWDKLLNQNLVDVIGKLYRGHEIPAELRIMKSDDTNTSSLISEEIRCDVSKLPKIDNRYNAIILGQEFFAADHDSKRAALLRSMSYLKSYYGSDLLFTKRLLVERAKLGTLKECIAFEQKLDQSLSFKNLYNFHEEYVDSDVARQSIDHAQLMENYCEKYAKHRVNKITDIKRLLEAEQRWYYGPKGYQKYGDPAYELAWIAACEKNKI